MALVIPVTTEIAVVVGGVFKTVEELEDDGPLAPPVVELVVLDEEDELLEELELCDEELGPLAPKVPELEELEELEV